MISLLFKFLGDSSPLKAEAAKVKTEMGKAGGEVGKEFGAQFKGMVMGFVGAGAIVGAIKGLVTEAAKIEQGATKLGTSIEGFQELTKAAEAVGMSVEELQAAAPKITAEFMNLMEAVRANGGILNEDTVKDLSDAAAEMNSFIGPIAQVIGGLVKVLGWIRAAGQAVVETEMAALLYARGKLPGGDGGELGRQMFSDTVDAVDGGSMSGFRTSNNETRTAALDFAAANRARTERISAAMAGVDADAKLAKKIIGGDNASGPFNDTEAARKFIEKLDEIKAAIKEN